MNWIKCSDDLPDAETTVMTYEPDSCEPIWPGYHDDGKWFDVAGGEIHPTHWMCFPDPPEV